MFLLLLLLLLLLQPPLLLLLLLPLRPRLSWVAQRLYFKPCLSAHSTSAFGHLEVDGLSGTLRPLVGV